MKTLKKMVRDRKSKITPQIKSGDGILTDKINQGILKYLIKKKKAFFNEMSRELSESKIVSRRTLYGRLMEMENDGILESNMVRLKYGEPGVQRWVKEYCIVEKNMSLVREALELK